MTEQPAHNQRNTGQTNAGHSNSSEANPYSASGELDISIGKEELVIRNRYETAILFNDFLIALWFILGSAFFLMPHMANIGAWVFLFASIQFLIRPALGLIRNIRIKKIRAAS